MGYKSPNLTVSLNGTGRNDWKNKTFRDDDGTWVSEDETYRLEFQHIEGTKGEFILRPEDGNDEKLAADPTESPEIFKTVPHLKFEAGRRRLTESDRPIHRLRRLIQRD